MGDIVESRQTEVQRITGNDENYVASVFPRTDGKNAIAVDAMVKTNNNGVTSQYLNSKYRVVYDPDDVTIPTTVYTLVYEYVGSGLLHGFHTTSDSDKLKFKLVIDNEEIFTELIPKNIGDMGMKVASDCPVRIQGRSGIVVLSNSELDFSPQHDIMFASHVRLYAISTDHGSKKIQNRLFYISKFS